MFIQIKNLSKVFKKNLAVDKISFHIEKNKTVGLLGPNGCGKTTSIGMMLGLIKPSEGEIISRVLKVSITKKDLKIKSPGMLKKHYSPGIPILLNQKTFNKKHAFITLGNKYKNNKNCFNLSKKSDLKEAASNLYKTFRKIKKQGFKKIYVVKIPNKGPGIAINDRLKRAAN